MKSLDKATVAVIGLGLMGGSLAAALSERRAVACVRGVARRAETASEALARGWVDEVGCDPAAAVASADIVVFGTPVLTTIAMLRDLSGQFPPDCIVTDMGSTKSAVVAAMCGLPAAVQPIGGHPMCGKEVAGLDAAEPDLFCDKVWVLSPLARTSDETVDRMHALAHAVGARSVIVEAARHDRLVAAISHLPYVLASCLVAAAEDFANGDDLVWQLASSGFRDTSRLAGSETNMMRDILVTNRHNVKDAVHSLKQHLAEMEEYLNEGAEVSLVELMERVRRRREGMFR